MSLGAPNPACNPCGCQSFTRAEYVNMTEVTDSYVTDDFPYPRCGDVEGDNCPNSCSEGGGPECGPWPLSFRPTVAGIYLLDNENLYALSETPLVTSIICPSPGFKCAQNGGKQWHGAPPFNFCPDGCTGLTTKYLKIEVSITGMIRSSDAGFCTEVIVYDETRSWTVNRYSGEITATTHCNSWNRVQTSPGVWENVTPVSPDTLGFYAVPDVCDPDSVPALYDFFRSQSDSITATVAIGETGIEYHILNAVTDSEVPPSACAPEYQEYMSDGKLVTAQLDVVVEYSNPYTAANVLSDAITSMGRWSLKNHFLIPFRSDDSWQSVGVIATYKEKSATSPQSGPNNCATIDDYEHPTAGSGTAMDPYTAWAQIAWRDPDVYVWQPEGADFTRTVATGVLVRYDGSIIGAPFTPGDGSPEFPQGMPDRNFGWDHKTYACYNDETGDHHEVRWWGAESGTNVTTLDATDSVIPKSANRWTNNEDAGYGYPGASAVWLGTSALFLQKNLQSAVTLPSYNFFGPSGFQRHELDYDNYDSITATTGDPDAPASGDIISSVFTSAPGEKVVAFSTEGLVAGVNSFKIFTVASIPGAGQIELGPQDMNARNVADAYQLWLTGNAGGTIPTGDYGCIGALRRWYWPSTFMGGAEFIPASIVGKIRVVSAVQDGGDVVITLAHAAKYLQIDDLMDFVANDSADTVNNDNSGAGFEISAVDSDTVFRFVGTLDALTMVGYLKTHDWPVAAIWNSVAPRRNFVWASFPADDTTGEFGAATATDDRHHGVNTSLGCTPNADLAEVESRTDNYPLGTGHPFPTALPTTCGNKAVVIVQQQMTHPLVRIPRCFAPTGGEALCADVSICAPIVEAVTPARVAEYVALGAAPLPDGVTPAITNSMSPVGFSCDPPKLIPNGTPAPWNNCESVWTPPA